MADIGCTWSVDLTADYSATAFAMLWGGVLWLDEARLCMCYRCCEVLFNFSACRRQGGFEQRRRKLAVLAAGATTGSATVSFAACRRLMRIAEVLESTYVDCQGCHSSVLRSNTVGRRPLWDPPAVSKQISLAFDTVLILGTVEVTTWEACQWSLDDATFFWWNRWFWLERREVAVCSELVLCCVA